MLIDETDLIQQQLAIRTPAEVSFADGRRTTLTPVSYVPRVDGPEHGLSLAGDWRVTRWPFEIDESLLVSPGVTDHTWATVRQPGKVFYLDPDEQVDHRPRRNRVTLAHIDPQDGAVLRRTVRIPTSWTNQRVHLRFDAIYPGGRVYVNGTLLGEHTSGLTPVEYDITEHVEPGREALVAVRLLRRHPFVQMDMPRHAAEFAGLAQEACLHATGPCHIAGHHLVSSLDDNCSSGVVAGPVHVANYGREPVEAGLSVCVIDRGGQQIAADERRIRLGAGEEQTAALRLDLAAVETWSDEFPRLYRVVIGLDVPGQAAQQVSFATGFRRLELADGRATLNGRFIKFRGVNHLTYHPEFGLHTPADWLRRNLALMKKANVNAIRTHFLGPRCLADLCDELGIYLLQELPVDWGTDYIADVEWVGPALQRLAGGILRDRHHPSVMVWSVGNENMPAKSSGADDGWHHLRIYEQFAKTLDPTRPTMFPPPGPANKVKGIFELRVGDIADTHYSFRLARDFLATGTVTNPRTWDGQMETTTRQQALARGWSGVWFSSEYGITNMMPDLLHAPYGSIIDDVREDPLSGRNSQEVFYDRLRREWGFMRSEASCLGGAYFPWMCSAAGDNPWGWVVWAEDNDWGVVTADLLPKSFFWVLRVLFSPVWFPDRVAWRPGQESICFELTNQYNGIDLKDCTLRTLMGRGLRMGARRWRDIPLSCPPGATCTATVPLWNPDSLEALSQGHAIAVRCVLLDPTGFRPITADVLVVPESVRETREALAVGPDAVQP